MKADISRSTFDALKDYSGVRMQQGRVQVDADWNEQLDIQHHRERTSRRDIIGAAGVSRQDLDLDSGERGGFELTVDSATNRLALNPGRIYVDGILCELHEGDPNAQNLDPVGIVDQPDQGRYLVYLDVWEREVLAAEDPSIVDPALLVPDTAVRSKVEWTVGAIRWTGGQGVPSSQQCEELLEQVRRGDDALPRMSAYVDEGESTEGPCIVPTAAGYRGIENQLYRVEVHRGSAQGVAPTFKWSRENGAVVFGLASMSTGVVELSDLGIDDKFGLEDGDIVEVVSVDRQARGELAGPLATVKKKPAEGARAFELDVQDLADVYNEIEAAFQPGDAVYLRRWDHDESSSLEDGAVAFDGSSLELELEHGVRVALEDAGHTYRSGDYWLVAARASNDRRASGEVLWPTEAGVGQLPQFRYPEGTGHHYAALALVEVVQDGDFSYEPVLEDGQVSDCRIIFPPLTDIRAEDVSYDNSECERIDEATNVQEAIDELCHSIHDTCEFVLRADRDWRSELEAFIADRDEVQICVPAKTFVLDEPLKIEGLETVRITGAGRASRFDAASGTGALIFKDCTSVQVRDLSVSAGLAASKEQAGDAISVLDCVDVEVRDVDVVCAGTWQEQTSCIYVRFFDADLPANKLEICGCDLQVGHRQAGITVIDAGRFRAQNNHIWVDPNDPAASFEDLGKHTSLRNQFVDRFFASATDEKPRASEVEYEAVSHNDQSVWFQTDPHLNAGWAALLDQEPPTGIDSARELLEYLHDMADKILFEGHIPQWGSGFNPWTQWAEDVQSSVEGDEVGIGGPYGMGAIVVAGQVARQVRVVQNDIERFVCGVHVGLSNAKVDADPLVAPDVLIRDNDVDVTIPYGYNRERHGVFVGHFDKLAVHGNHVNATTAPHTYATDGVRVYGVPGRHMSIKDNYVAGFTTGVHTVFVYEDGNSESEASVWSVIDNFATCELMRTPDSEGEAIEVVHTDVTNKRNLA
jgi:hypothetical protein